MAAPEPGNGDEAHRAPPVIAIDGTTASGKGTVAAGVAGTLGFHYLDSGALYRLVGLAALRSGTPLGEAAALGALAARLPARLEGARAWLAAEEVTQAIRSEACGEAASKIAVHPEVRAALLGLQRASRRAPGLVADGRDMGSVVFPEAVLKIYLTASLEERARRRHKQLIAKGITANIHDLASEIAARDQRDSSRAAAPLILSPDAIALDTTGLSIEETVARVVALFRERASGSRPADA
jgi:cytidylate kinase